MPVTDIDLQSVNLLDPDLFVDGPPHELFARMRAECPVRWNPTEEGEGFWSVTKAGDIELVSKDVERFSSARESVWPNERVAPMPKDVVRATMLGMDPPQHTKYRGIVQKVFTVRTVAVLEDAVRERVTRLIDDVCERGECDFVKDIATELPLQTIATMLGVPLEDRARLFEWTLRIERAGTEGTDDGLVAFGEMAQYLVGLVEDRKANPRDDLITALINAELDGEKLNDLELTAFFGILMFAGSDTTRNTSSGALLELLRQADQWEALRAATDLRGAVEEFIRWVSPINYFRRTPTEDVEIRGVEIKEGDAVVLWYASGSRDEELVDDPMRFDVTREEVRHQAFGGGGRHFCIGNQLARLQLRVLFEELTRRLPDIELAGEPERTRSSWINGLNSLPVRFTPTAREAGR
ncbi:MAG: cytochrome P450 [Actinobacteria bacterium]|nr:MAG: cytochrome P450 [Actinomycetota bacterium]